MPVVGSSAYNTADNSLSRWRSRTKMFATATKSAAAVGRNAVSKSAFSTECSNARHWRNGTGRLYRDAPLLY